MRADAHGLLITLQGKTGPRTFPIIDVELMERIKDRLDGSDEHLLVFRPKHRKQALRSRLTRACVKTGVEHFTPHGLRRLVVDTMARSGVDVGTAACLTGHSPTVMLKFYRQVSNEDKRAGVMKAQLGNLPSGEILEGPWKDFKEKKRSQ